MAVTARGDRLAAQFNTLVARLRRASAARVLVAWDGLDRYDVDLIAGFVRTIAPVVAGTQAQVAAAVDAYMASFLAAETGVPEAPKGLATGGMVGAAVRNGADIADVYRRPFVTVWAALARGVQWQEAVANGRQRLVSTVETDVMLAHRQAVADWTSQDERVVGYRRVLSAGSCDLCAVASTQRYKSGDLMPIHNHCDCTTEPIIGDVDPGRVIDSRSKPGPDVKVVEHGELGPLLVPADQQFTGPDDIAA